MHRVGSFYRREASKQDVLNLAQATPKKLNIVDPEREQGSQNRPASRRRRRHIQPFRMINPFALVGETTWEVGLATIRALGVFFVAFNLAGPAFIACRLI